MTPGRGPIRWVSRLPLGRPAPEESVAWEVEHHLAELVDRLVEEGWSEEEARSEARRRFGDPRRYVPSMKRLERGRTAMERRAQARDFVVEGLGGALRTARRAPGFTAGVALTLALGIGANATIYGIVDRLLLQPPMHVMDHDEVRRVVGRRPSSLTGEILNQETITYPDYADLKAHRGFEAVAAYSHDGEVTVGSGESATRAFRVMTSYEFFALLGVQPVLGRFYSADEAAPGAPLTAVLGEEYWERAYGRDPDVLGREIEADGLRHVIIGVAPRGFTGVGLERVDLWLPLEATNSWGGGGGAGCLESRGCWWMRAVARLDEGVSVAAAEAEATRLHRNGRREQIEEGDFPQGARIALTPLIAAEGPNASDEAAVARWLAGVSLIVLLIACANVTNLLLARSTHRRREVAVRLALGVPRARLVGLMVAESLVLALLGGGVALLLARWGGGLVRSVLLPGVYFPDSALNGRVLAFTLVASLVAGFVAGLVPAVQGSRADLTHDLGDAARGSSAGRSRLRALLTVFQAAMSVVLLVGAGLFVRSLDELRSLDLGLDSDRLLSARIEFRSDDLDDAAQTALYEEARRRVEALPSVESAAATAVPFQYARATSLDVPGLYSIPRLPGGGPYYFPVTPGYFETVGVRILRGRAIEASDGPDERKIAVVSETMARVLWPDQEALGGCLMIGRDAEECTTVVGLAEDAARGGYQDRSFMAYYLPLAQTELRPIALYVRARGDVVAAAVAVAPVLRSFSPEVRYASVESLQEILRPQARSWTLGATMFTVFGLLALALAAIGLYGVLAFDVAQRTRELGIRTALGAERARLLRSVLVQGGSLGAVGVLVGLGTAYFAAPYAADLLFEVSPRDPSVLGSVAVVLVVVSVAASLMPGMRATRVDPVEALRSE